jgi:hypothetical protein
MRRTYVALLASFALLVAGCGGGDTATTTSTADDVTTTTVATTTTPPVDDTTSSTTSSTTTTSTTEAPAPVPPDGSMLITNEDGIFVATLDGASSQLLDADSTVVGGMVHFAIDDTRGGIVIQPHESPWTSVGDDSIIYWVPQGSSNVQELLVPAADQGLRLEDVATRDGVTSVYYTRRFGDTPDTAEQTLRRFDLDDRTVSEIALVGGWESGSSPISVGGDTIVRNGSGEAYFWITFTDLDNNEFASPANPIPDGGFDCVPECFYYADLSPDGSEVAFGRLAPNGSGFYTTPEIEVRDIASGDLLLSVTLPELSASGYIDSVDLSATHVLINIVEEGSDYPVATVVDLASGLSVVQAPVNGVARFLRSVPDLAGVISWP